MAMPTTPRCPSCGADLSATDCGKPLLARVKELESDRADDKAYIEDLCKDLCKMEDALGFKNDCSDKQGAFIPTIGPWLERLRDLIATEGELGDMKERVKRLEGFAQSIAKQGCISGGSGRCSFVNSLRKLCIACQAQKALETGGGK